jgi:hypothetical protein
VADVLSADSSQVCEDAWLGVRNHSRRSEYKWPRTAKPVERHWLLWRQAIVTALDVSSHRRTGWNLGQWTSESISRWNWRLDAISGKLFHREGSVWVSWRPTGRPGLRSTSCTFVKGNRVSRLPPQSQPVSVRRLTQRHKAQVTGAASLQDGINTSTKHTTFLESLQGLRDNNPEDACGYSTSWN